METRQIKVAELAKELAIFTLTEEAKALTPPGILTDEQMNEMGRVTVLQLWDTDTSEAGVIQRARFTRMAGVALKYVFGTENVADVVVGRVGTESADHSQSITLN
jgi:hypothetical protein